MEEGCWILAQEFVRGIIVINLFLFKAKQQLIYLLLFVSQIPADLGMKLIWGPTCFAIFQR
jgi:hypothetical protein